MKVILLQDIKGVGKKDQIINASDGYAKNYLIPKKLALLADKENMNKLEAKNASVVRQKESNKKEAEKLREKLKEITLNISVKTGENGKLFGSITSKEISENLKEQYKIEIDKKKLILNNPIKELGMFNIEIKLNEGIIANLKINITNK